MVVSRSCPGRILSKNWMPCRHRSKKGSWQDYFSDSFVLLSSLTKIIKYNLEWFLLRFFYGFPSNLKISSELVWWISRSAQTIPGSTSHHILTYDSEMIFIFSLLQNDDHFRGGSYPVFTIYSSSHSFIPCHSNILEKDNIVLFFYGSSLSSNKDQLIARKIVLFVPQMISSSHFSTLVAAMHVLKYDYSLILLFL